MIKKILTEQEYLKYIKEKYPDKPDDWPLHCWLTYKRDKIEIHITWIIIVIILLCLMFQLSKPNRQLTLEEEQEMQE